jgi:hypothetical protein
VKRHLAAFEAGDGDASPGLLAFDAATGGLALTRTGTATDAHASLYGTGAWGEFIELGHLRLSPEICRRA